MPKIKKGYIWGAIIIILLGTFAYRVADKFFKPKPTIAEQGVPVEIETAKLGSIQNDLLLTGNAEAEEQVTISTKRSNRIERIYVAENQAISHGQLLVQMDVSDLNAQMAQNNAQVTASQASANQVKTQMNNALTNLSRMKSLFAQGAISQEQLDNAQTQYSALVAQHQASLAQTKAMRSGVSYVAALAGDTSIKAPFNGMVIAKSAEVGEVIDAGKPILVVAKVDRMKVKASVSEMDVRKIKVGQEVKVTIDALPGEAFKGRITQILPEVTVQSRSLVAEIIIENPEFKIKPGMFARANITTEKHDQVVIIAKQAVIYKDNKSYVYIVEGDKSKLIPVTLGINQGQKVEIVNGVKAGDKVITVGQNVIDDNILLDVRKVGE